MNIKHMSGQLPHSLAKADMLNDPDLSFRTWDKGVAHLVSGKTVMSELPTEEPVEKLPRISLDVVCRLKVA